MSPAWVILSASIILAIIFVIWPDFFTRLVKSRKGSKGQPKEGSKAETYGHPKPPAKTLVDGLCSPPAGFGWEVSVVDKLNKNKDVTPHLCLALVNLSSLETLSLREECLVVRRYSGSTWTKEYRGETPNRCLSMFRYGLIEPFLTWALDERDEHIKHASNGEYFLKAD